MREEIPTRTNESAKKEAFVGYLHNCKDKEKRNYLIKNCNKILNDNSFVI